VINMATQKAEEQAETEWWTDAIDPSKTWFTDHVGREVEYKWLPVAKSWD